MEGDGGIWRVWGEGPNAWSPGPGPGMARDPDSPLSVPTPCLGSCNVGEMGGRPAKCLFSRKPILFRRFGQPVGKVWVWGF